MSFSKTCSYDVADSFTFIKELPTEKGFSTFFWYLYQNRICTDVKFLLETDYGYKEFQAHKLILSMMSPHFAEKFYKDGKCSKKMEEIVLQKVDPEAFEAMLRFIYGGILPQLDSPKQASDLFKTATEFRVQSLVVKCKEFLNRIDVKTSNVFTFLEVAECMQNRSLIDRCLALIQGRTCEVMNSYTLPDITPSMMHVILDQPYLSLPSVYELLKWVFAWAEMKANRENANYRNMREVLEKILPDMHFLQLSNVEFAEICRDYDGFFTSDEITSIFMNIAVPGSKEMPDWYVENRTLHVQPEQNAKSKQERVDKSCLSNSDDEKLETSQKENKESRYQQIKSKVKKSLQNENEETSDQQSDKLHVQPEQNAKSKQERVEESCLSNNDDEVLETKRKENKEPKYQQIKSEVKKSFQNESEEASDQQSSGEELEFENDEKQKKLLRRIQGALKNMEENSYQQSTCTDEENDQLSSGEEFECINNEADERQMKILHRMLKNMEENAYQLSTSEESECD